MRIFDYLAYAVALIFYVPRLALFWVYRALLFISKPGSLYILPGILAALFYWQYDLIRGSFAFEWWLNDVVMPFAPHERITEDYWYLGFFWCCFTFGLYLLTGGRFQILGTVLSSLPQIRRPFPPMLRLRLKELKICPAAVQIAVPRLKRRPKGLNAKEGLSEPLRRLLEPLPATGHDQAEIASESAPEAPELEELPTPAETEVKMSETPPPKKRRPPPPPLPPKAQC